MCGNNVHKIPGTKQGIEFYHCKACGRIAVGHSAQEMYQGSEQDQLMSYLYYNNKDKLDSNGKGRIAFIGDRDTFEEIKEEKQYWYVDKNVVGSWYPLKFSDKVDAFLLNAAQQQNYVGEDIEFASEEYNSVCFVNRFSVKNPEKEISATRQNQQFTYFLQYLVDSGYIKAGGGRVQIQPEGLTRIDQLQRAQVEHTKNVFIAMSFDKDMELVREAIKEAVTECGFVPRIMDEIEHNHQIVPEMLYEIRQSRFVVAELTGHNNGAYFEAGYALGQGKEVIQICNKDQFGDDGHFDVKQINTILWKDTQELTKRLSERIKSTIL